MSNEKREQQMMDAADRYADEVCDESCTGAQVAETINDFCTGWRAADSYPNWISVEDELPPFTHPEGASVKNTSDYVLVYNGYMVYISRLVGGEIKWWEDNRDVHPTHWMPIVPCKKGGEQ